MGSKIILSPDDELFNTSKINIIGLSGGCYCCGQQIHLPFKNLEILPSARIEGKYYYVLICDICEEDVKFLKEKGLSTVSYDILWVIQDELNEKIFELNKKKSRVSEVDRKEILYRLYLKVSDKKRKNI